MNEQFFLETFDRQEEAYLAQQVALLSQQPELRRRFKPAELGELEWERRVEEGANLILERNSFEGFQLPSNNRPSNEHLALSLVTCKGPCASGRPILAGLAHRFVAQLTDDAAFVVESDWVRGSDMPHLTTAASSALQPPGSAASQTTSG
eukprot:Protomagalhaensia_wolfi_Nauph_80__1712@NODE_2063_length_1227_cov_35_196970_g1611_i0_p1_GENE_NODE_2063_length_1227_cov_35_196970_g1611_i0NODE_2063_length_1227_cov_35_196970_g1611_i0_p1_ORF_typecomplete_len150_score25_37_NODE_2063_length_1227_cov_35_196970_g1611_i0444893